MTSHKNNDLDKLSAEMKKMRPSKTARASGMNAAMAAFDSEFSGKFAAENISAQENISQASQGLETTARPTGQTTRNGRAATFGDKAMTKLSEIFTFNTRKATMMGSCAAALMAAMVYLPYATDGVKTDAPTGITVDAGTPDLNNIPEDMKVVERIIPPVTNTGGEIVVTGEVTTELLLVPMTDAEKKAANAPVAPVVAPNMPTSKSKNPAAPVVTPQVGTSNTNTPQQFTVFNGTSNQVVESTETIVGQTGEILARIEIPAQYKTVTNNGKVERILVAPSRQASTLTAPAGEMPPGNPLPPPPVIQRQSAANVAVAPQLTSTYTPSTQTRLPGGLTLEKIPAEFEFEMQTVVTQEASSELVTIPATFETVTETVVVQPQSVEYVTIPPVYEWVDGEIEGSSIEYDTIPAEYETVVEPVIVQEASTELVTIPATYQTVMEIVVLQPQYEAPDGSVVPAVTKQETRRVIKTPASTQERTIPAVTKMETRRVVKTPASTVERVVPNEIKDGKTRIAVKPATTQERAIPAVTKQVTRRVVKTPARTQERAAPNVTKQVEVQKVVTPARYYLRDDDGVVVREFASRDAFEIYQANLPTSVEETPVSTFSIDVDTASYSFMRASLNRGQLPPRSSIRLEEMINYFPYDYKAPKSADEPFKANVTVTQTPWNAETKLMHIGIKGYVPKATEKPRSNIVFLIDTSGSMRNQNKLPLLVSSFKLLLSTLEENDMVSIVRYAGGAGTVLEPTSASDMKTITAALDNLQARGSTAGAAGLELAYQKAQENFDDEGVNRVILATDGDFNVGFSSPDEMKRFIEKKRETGIFLSVLGFGMGNYNDHLMQSLAQNGNGVAAYIDNLAEANKVLANAAGSALYTIAKDVKIQVEFNPETVAEYRLIGYETRALKRQDFNNDKVDAGEIGAGHTVTAIYEMTPVGSASQTVDKLRYVSDKLNLKTAGSDEFAFVKIRHKLPSADTSTLQTFPVGPKQERSLKRASDDMRFAAAVAAVGQKLRGDTPLNDFSYADAIKLASGAKGEDEKGYRSEFIQLVRLAESLDK